ncbi:hydrolase [Agromyces luteolus]|uniref:nitrilase-related carbon-nitrogen hydrolase n=1 Tax=Agromyces luteolus TaxID=88373 RepID=UPI001411DE30|nr:nitrilase-related carbon-nitrogen hydrolase [Agromyces luteolus]GLK27126.1 hydrolase [Agromyces luteolus]
MRLTLAQIDSDADAARNLRRIGAAVERAAAAGSTLVVFPEYAMYEKHAVDATFAEVAEPVDGEFCSALSALASSHRVAIVAGIVEQHPDGDRPFNTLVVIGRDGRLLGRHRKIHLYDAYGFHESAWISPAEHPEPTVVEVDGVRVGLMTCSDVRHSELGVALAKAGAEIVALCASWVPGEHKLDQWRVLARARAIEHLYFVAAVSQAAPISIGSSLVVDPMGEVIASLDEEPALLTLDVDITEVAARRAAAAR